MSRRPRGNPSSYLPLCQRHQPCQLIRRTSQRDRPPNVNTHHFISPKRFCRVNRPGCAFVPSNSGVQAVYTITGFLLYREKNGVCVGTKSWDHNAFLLLSTGFVFNHRHVTQRSLSIGNINFEYFEYFSTLIKTQMRIRVLKQNRQTSSRHFFLSGSLPKEIGGVRSLNWL